MKRPSKKDIEKNEDLADSHSALSEFLMDLKDKFGINDYEIEVLLHDEMTVKQWKEGEQ